MSYCICDSPMIHNTTTIKIKNNTKRLKSVIVTAPSSNFIVQGQIKPDEYTMVYAPFDKNPATYEINSEEYRIRYSCGRPGEFWAYLYDNGWVIVNNTDLTTFNFNKDLNGNQDLDLDVSLTYPTDKHGLFKLPKGKKTHTFYLPYIQDQRSNPKEFEVTAANYIENILAKAHFKTNDLIPNNTINATFTYNALYHPRGIIRIPVF